jgi:hypothetical protein
MRVLESLNTTFCAATHLMKQHVRCVVRRTRSGCKASCWRKGRLGITLIPVYLFLFALSAIAQVEGLVHPQPMNPQVDQDHSALVAPSIPETSPAPPMEAIQLPLGWPIAQPALPELPARVAIPADRPIAVVLDTPLSTRISKKGESVTFRTTNSILLGDGLEVPPDMEIAGHVVEVRKPAHFGKQGVLRVTVDRLNLDTGNGANLEAHVDSRDMKGQGQLTSDNRRSTDLYSVAVDSIAGTLLGAMIGGAKGAGIGAGAGAAAAVLIMMSHRGQDVYLEPGMPFSVVLDQPAYLSGAAIYAAQQNYLKNRRSPAAEVNSQPGGQPKDVPQLKRRRPQPHI